MENFFDTQRQLTMLSLIQSGRNSKFLCMLSLPTSIYQKYQIYNNREKVETNQYVKSLKIWIVFK